MLQSIKIFIFERVLNKDPVLIRLSKMNFFVVLVWFLLMPLIYTADTTSYLFAAKKMVGAHKTFLYFRTEGYPLFLILTGGLFGTLYGVLVAQFILALLIPILVYKILLHFSQKAAFLGVILSLASTFSFACAKFIMTQQLYLCVQLLFLLFVVKLLQAFELKKYLWVAGLSFVLFLIRPSAACISLITLGFFGVFNFMKQGWSYCVKYLLIGFFFLAALNTIHGYYHRWISDPIVNFSQTSGGFIPKKGGSGTSMAGKTFFNQLYIISPFYGAGIKRENGFYTNLIFETYHDFMADYEKKYPIKNIGVIPEERKNILWILEKPDAAKFYFLWLIMDEMHGAEDSDKIFQRASFELLKTHPTVLQYYLNNFFHFFVGKDIVTHYGKMEYKNPQLFDFQDIPNSKSLSREIKRSHISSYHKIFYGYLGFYYLLVKWVLCLGSIWGLFSFVQKKDPPLLTFFSVFLIIYGGYEASIICLFSTPFLAYYVFCFFPFLMFALLSGTRHSKS